jgi:hypothetical protein
LNGDDGLLMEYKAITKGNEGDDVMNSTTRPHVNQMLVKEHVRLCSFAHE